MTILSSHTISSALTGDRDALSSALDVAVKVYSLLPDYITLSTLMQMPGHMLGQVAAPDDAMAIAWVSSIAQRSGWVFEHGQPEHNQFTHCTYMRIAASTEIDGVKVTIWTHITAGVESVTTTGAAA